MGSSSLIQCKQLKRKLLLNVSNVTVQLVRNRRYEAVDCESSRLVSQEVCDLWRPTTPDQVNISDNFLQREFSSVIQHLKRGKAPDPDSIKPELIIHAEAVLKS